MTEISTAILQNYIPRLITVIITSVDDFDDYDDVMPSISLSFVIMLHSLPLFSRILMMKIFPAFPSRRARAHITLTTSIPRTRAFHAQALFQISRITRASLSEILRIFCLTYDLIYLLQPRMNYIAYHAAPYSARFI